MPPLRPWIGNPRIKDTFCVVYFGCHIINTGKIFKEVIFTSLMRPGFSPLPGAHFSF